MGFESQSFAITAERQRRPVGVQFERKSFEGLTSKGVERIEAVKETFTSVREGIKDKALSLWSRVKTGASRAAELAMATPEIVASLPEMAQYGFEAGKAKVQEGYETAADFVQGKIAETRFEMSQARANTIESVRGKFNALENKALNVVSGFAQKVSDISETARAKVEEHRGSVNSERRAEQMATYQSLLEKARELGLVVSVEGMATAS